MKDNLAKLEISSQVTSISTSISLRSGQEGVVKLRKNGAVDQLLGAAPNKVNDETYRQINSVSFSDDFKILVKHYRF